MKVRAVSAYVPLEVKHLTAVQYKDYGNRLVDTLGDKIKIFWDYPLTECWLYEWLLSKNWLNLPPAHAVAADRYATPQHFVMSNIVQHQRTSWAVQAANEDPDVEAWVWLDLGVLKQGDWTGKPVTEQIIADFMKKLEDKLSCYDIPFPGIWDKGEPSDTEVCWRFVGSTHIWPTRYLSAINFTYKRECRRFIDRTQTIPLDLPIWANVELNSHLPFVKYDANHDATQFTGYQP
jgi:hypothetical protein